AVARWRLGRHHHLLQARGKRAIRRPAARRINRLASRVSAETCTCLQRGLPCNTGSSLRLSKIKKRCRIRLRAARIHGDKPMNANDEGDGTAAGSTCSPLARRNLATAEIIEKGIAMQEDR